MYSVALARCINPIKGIRNNYKAETYSSGLVVNQKYIANVFLLTVRVTPQRVTKVIAREVLAPLHASVQSKGRLLLKKIVVMVNLFSCTYYFPPLIFSFIIFTYWKGGGWNRNR